MIDLQPILFAYGTLFLRQRFALKLADEFCSEQSSSSENVLDGFAITEILCKELAYSSGEYTIQKALERMAQTDRGFQTLLYLSSKAKLTNEKPDTIIFDCISRLLRLVPPAWMFVSPI